MGVTYPTSKNNALASLAYFVEQNVLDTNESFYANAGPYENAIEFPCITMIDRGAPELPPSAFNDFLGNDPAHDQQYGRWSQTVVEFNVMDKTTTVQGSPNPYAVKNVMESRERLRRALYWAGQVDVNGAQIFPDIQLLDFDTNGNPWTGGYVEWPSGEQNTWYENSYLASADDPQLKRIQISVRIKWTEILT